MVASVEFENTMVLAVVQALIGAVPPELLAVTLHADDANQTLDVYFAVRGVSEQLEELVEEIEADITALIDFSIVVRPHVWVGATWVGDWPGAGYRPVFAAMVQRMNGDRI